MMHGPLQFHLIALMYWLFGVTDATARFASVFSGIFVVMSPFFLRRQMGRIPAMVCAFLLFISPSILYFSRMAREDAIFSGMEMIMLVGLWRFVSERKPTDFVIFMAGLALMFTIKETAYLTVLVLAVLGLALFAVQAGYAFMAALGAYGAGAALIYYFVNNGMKAGTIPPLPDIPQVSPNFDIIWQFMGGFFGHPLVYGLLALTAAFLVAVTVMMRSQRGGARLALATAGAGVPARKSTSTNGVTTRRVTPDEGEATGNGLEPVETVAGVEGEAAPAGVEPSGDASPVYNPSEMRPSPGSATSRYQPGSIPHLIGSLFSRPSVLVAGLGVAAAIYITLYTVFFTDIPRGLISGPFGSLGYWMAQHDVVRGDQPWYYYSLLIPLYEPIAVFFSLAAILFFTWRGARWAYRRVRGEVEPGEPYPQRFGWFNTERTVPFATFTSFMPLFLIVWLLGVFTIYSWAGEKMPWLMMHMVRPAIFLASLFVGALIISLIKRRRERIAEAGVELYAPQYTTALATPTGSLPTRKHTPAVQFVDDRRRTTDDKGRRWGRLAPMPGNLALAGAAASAGGLPQTVAMSGGYARGAVLPARKRGPAKYVEEPQYLEGQEPPWVTWNRPGSLFPFFSYLAIFIIMVLAWGLKMNALTYFNRYADWGLTWIFPLIILLVTIGYAVWIGPGRALKYLGVGILAAGLMYQFRSANNLSYNNPDVPTEMATYVQTSPHVVSMICNLHEFANLTASSLSYPAGSQAGPRQNIKVMYDSFTSWPMEWYLRDFDKQFIGSGEATPGTDVPVLMLEYAKHNSNENLKRDYQVIRYPMRWWFPEEWYKDEFIPNRWAKDASGNSVTDPETGKRKESPLMEQVGGALGTIRATVTEPQLQATLWKYLTFRETPKPLGSEDMLLFVRKDIAQAWHRIQYEPPPPSMNVELRALPEKEWWLTDPKTGR
jgi:predicted membrane-bound mannosyltransferase